MVSEHVLPSFLVEKRGLTGGGEAKVSYCKTPIFFYCSN